MKKFEPIWFLTFIALILLLLIAAQTQLFAQSILERKVTINIKDETLKTALDKITTASGIKFTYNEQVAASKIKVTIKSDKELLKQVLAEITAAHPVRFSELDKEIHVRLEPEKVKKPNAGPAANPSTGLQKYSEGDMI